MPEPYFFLHVQDRQTDRVKNSTFSFFLITSDERQSTFFNHIHILTCLFFLPFSLQMYFFIGRAPLCFICGLVEYICYCYTFSKIYYLPFYGLVCLVLNDLWSCLIYCWWYQVWHWIYNSSCIIVCLGTAFLWEKNGLFFKSCLWKLTKKVIGFLK